MNAFNNEESVRDAFRKAVGEIIARASTDRFHTILERGKGGVRQLTNFLLRGLNDKLSYDKLGFPDKLILLTLAILHELPEKDRQPWLDLVFRSVGVGADLEEMQVWGKYVEWLLLHPFAGVINDIPLKSARQAVKEVTRLILTDSQDRDEWTHARYAVNQAKHQLFADAEAKGELTSVMGSGVPAIAGIYAALGIANLGSGIEPRSHVHILVSMTSTSVPLDQQGRAFVTLVLGGNP